MTAAAANFAGRLPELLGAVSDKLRLEEFSAKLGEKPARNTVAMLGLCAVAFYVAEKDNNEKVDDLWDALEYCSSSLSVGYTDVYPQTALGKIVASFLMTFGPSMVSRVTTGAETTAVDPKQEEILATLRAILTELKRRPAV